MNKVEVKTADLIGPALDWAVAKCSGIPLFTQGEDWPGNYKVTVLAAEQPVLIRDLMGRMWLEDHERTVAWSPSTDWSQGGPLIEKFCITIGAPDLMNSGLWESFIGAYVKVDDAGVADLKGVHESFGPTALIAACRAIVAAKLGDVVRVPAELVQGGTP